MTKPGPLETQQFSIDIGIPIPVKDRDATLADNLRRLSNAPLGASMLLPCASNIASNIGRQAIAAKNKWMTCRAVDDAVCRVWKIADPIF